MICKSWKVQRTVAPNANRSSQGIMTGLSLLGNRHGNSEHTPDTCPVIMSRFENNLGVADGELGGGGN